MTLTIELTPEQEAQFVAAATHNGLAPVEFLKQLVEECLPHSAPLTLAEILAPVHKYSHDQEHTEQEIGNLWTTKLLLPAPNVVSGRLQRHERTR